MCRPHGLSFLFGVSVRAFYGLKLNRREKPKLGTLKRDEQSLGIPMRQFKTKALFFFVFFFFAVLNLFIRVLILHKWEFVLEIPFF